MARLLIGSLEVSLDGFHTFEQNYTPLKAVGFQRTADGTGVLRSLWTGKLGVTISAEGWAPGIDEIDPGATHIISCAVPRAVTGTGTSIDIPATRRTDTDHDPAGFAIVGDREIPTTIINLAALNAETSDTATLDPIAGATGYRVRYWPKIEVAILTNSVKAKSDASFEWSLEAEEV